MSLRFVFHEPGCSSLLSKAKQYSLYEMITGELSGPLLLKIRPNPFFSFLKSKSEQRKCILRFFQPGPAGAENRRITLKQFRVGKSLACLVAFTFCNTKFH